MDVENIGTIFSDYGWPGIIAVIVILGMAIFLKFFKKNAKKTSESIDNIGKSLAESISKQNDNIVTAINKQNEFLVENLRKTNERLFSHVIDKEEKHEISLQYRKDISDVIIDLMRELRAEVNASRVAILEFHNSNANLGGLGFLGYDMKYERQQLGVDPVSSTIVNHDYAQLSWIVKQVNADKLHMLKLNEEGLKQMWDYSPVLSDELVNKIGIKSVVFAGIYNYLKTEIIGLLIIEYHTHIDDAKLEEYETEYYHYSSRLSQLLTVPENYTPGDNIEDYDTLKNVTLKKE